LIDTTLKEAGYHPFQVADEEHPDDFPPSDAAATEGIQDVAAALLGGSAFKKNGIHLRDDLRPSVSAIIRLAYEHHRKAWNRAKKSLETKRKEADEIMAGLYLKSMILG